MPGEGIKKDYVEFTNEIKANKKIPGLIGKLLDFSKPYELEDLESTLIPEYGCFETEADEKKYFGIFNTLVGEFLKYYYKKHLFPSSQYIYEIFFYEIKDNLSKKGNTSLPSSILNNVINDIEKYHLISDSLIIHPLSDFGFNNAGARLYFTKQTSKIYFRLSDFIIFPQANSLKVALENIKIAMKHFKLSTTKISKDLFEHYQRSRNTKWLINNPILIHHIKQSYTGYYENQYFIVKQLELHLSLLYLSKCISEKRSIEKTSLYDTNRTNNFQTYDEYHYFILNKNKEQYEPQCIPRHSKLSRLFDTFRLNIIMPQNLINTDKNTIHKIEIFLTEIYSRIYSSAENTNMHLLRRSLGYFVRSYQAEYYEDQILFLCIAFEMLLGEKVPENISGHIANIILLLKNGNREDIVEFKKLYASRSGVAHEGTSRDCDLNYCQYLFFEIVYRIVKLNEKEIYLSDEKCFTKYIERTIEKKLGFIPDVK